MTKTLGAMLMLVALAGGCSRRTAKEKAAMGSTPSAAAPYQVDSATAGAIHGTIRYLGKRPAPELIDMSEDPACVEAHHGKAFDESLLLGAKGAVANAFIYVKTGLEGKTFAVPGQSATIDQRGCWFHPRVLGLQTGQVLEVVNDDPVTHNIHPMATVNREWNHSQGPGDPPMHRKFLKPEVMVPVKCNIHRWMHAFIGVVDHPYFAVSAADGSFAIANLPPGTYTLEVWQEKLGTMEQRVEVQAHENSLANFTYKAQ